MSFVCVAEPWTDTTTPAGRMVLTVFAGIAEFERVLIIDRTRNGRVAAKARGVKFGPRPTLTPAQIEYARNLIDQSNHTVKDAASLLWRSSFDALPGTRPELSGDR